MQSLRTDLECAALAIKGGHIRIARAFLTSALGKANVHMPAARPHIMRALNYARSLPVT